jgi:thiamine pyrophosphokinase
MYYLIIHDTCEAMYCKVIGENNYTLSGYFRPVTVKATVNNIPLGDLCQFSFKENILFMIPMEVTCTT